MIRRRRASHQARPLLSVSPGPGRALMSVKPLWRFGIKKEGSRMESVDNDAVLAFARVWAPYGGPSPDDIFVEFGISRASFYRRVQSRLRALPPVPISETERHRLTDIINRHIRFASSHGHRSAAPDLSPCATLIDAAGQMLPPHPDRRSAERTLGCPDAGPPNRRSPTTRRGGTLGQAHGLSE